MYEPGYERRLIDATKVFEKHFCVARLDKFSWYGNIKSDPTSGCFYVYTPRFSAGDVERWECIGESFEEAAKSIESNRLR